MAYIINIAYIEDNPSDINSVLTCLQTKQPDGYIINYQVDTYQTLTDAIKRLYAREPDLILLDLNLPDSTGLETFEKIHKEINAPIIVLTGLMDMNMALQAMRLGAFNYLAKEWINNNPLLLHFMCLHTHQIYRQQIEIKDFIQERLNVFRPLIPRCKFCISRIGDFRLRDESNNLWHKFEDYFRQFGINFTDGICEDCLKKTVEE